MAIPPDPLIVRRLSHADRLLEVGIGDRHGVAAGLVAADADVRATDVRAVAVPGDIRFRVEDVTTVDSPDEFHQVDVIYALNCPPELHEPIRSLAERVGATFAFTTLGHDQPAIPVDRETLTGETDGTAVTERREPRVSLYFADTGPERR
jgi:uncharacterized UPF0146 family protein